MTAAAASSRRRTVGSSRYTSSPTSAEAIARRIAGVGFVTVSLRRSTTSPSVMETPSPRCSDELRQDRIGAKSPLEGEADPRAIPHENSGGLPTLPDRIPPLGRVPIVALAHRIEIDAVF